MMFSKAALFVGAGLATAADPQPNYVMMWNNFKNTFGKFYNGIDEEDNRFYIFKANVDIIQDVNAKNLSYTLGVNQFADLTADEFASQYTGLKKPENVWGDLPYLGRDTYSGNALDTSVDWTTKGAVTPVKNQRQCGSCWSFSTTGSLEGAWEIATGELVAFSEQQFVDCDKVDQGCNGGWMDNAFKYAEANAICTEESYVYTGTGGTCKASSCTVGLPLGGVTGYKDVETDNEQALMEALNKGPVSIAIEADQSAFSLYSGGILSSTCGSNLDHGVLAVGYGTDGGQDYWKVKNSWAASWGEQGYIRLLRGKGGAGECGLLSGPPSYPVVSGSAPGPTPPGPPSPPSPPTPPSPPAPSTSHYEQPPCQSDEMVAEIVGADYYEYFYAEVCAPHCDGGAACPTDAPSGTMATPECALQDAAGNQYCALMCSLRSGGCPPGATCSDINSGVCVYPSSRANDSRPKMQLKQSKKAILV